MASSHRQIKSNEYFFSPLTGPNSPASLDNQQRGEIELEVTKDQLTIPSRPGYSATRVRSETTYRAYAEAARRRWKIFMGTLAIIIALIGVTIGIYYIIQRDFIWNVGKSSAQSGPNSQLVGNPPPEGGVGPHKNWNGAANSGSGALDSSLPLRVTAKPAARWLVPDQDRLFQTTNIGVYADANGGISSVLYTGDIQTTIVNATTMLNDLDVNGRARKRPGYWFKLNAQAFLNVSTTGEIRIFAIVTANDQTMQQRIVGPLILYPRTVEYDKTFYVAATLTGPDIYPTFRQAMNALWAYTKANASCEAPRIVFKESGTYEGGTLPLAPNGDQFSGTIGQIWSGSKGYVLITHEPGVTARIVRGTAFDPFGRALPYYWDSSWEWIPGVDQMKFRGSGIIIDVKNFYSIRTLTNRPYLLEGIYIINSLRTRDTREYNGGTPFQRLEFHNLNNDHIQGYIIDCIGIYAWVGYGVKILSNTQWYNTIGSASDWVEYAWGNLWRDTDSRYYSTLIPSMVIRYNNNTPITSATVKIAGYLSTGTETVIKLAIDGVLQQSFSSYQGPNQLSRNISSIVQLINDYGKTLQGLGWEAYLLNEEFPSLYLNKGFNLSPQNVLNQNYTLSAAIDIHGECFHIYPPIFFPEGENCIIHGNSFLDSNYATSPVYIQTPFKDIIIDSNIIDASGNDGVYLHSPHSVVKNNLFMNLYSSFNYGDSYALVTQNIFLQGPRNDFSTMNYPILKENIYTESAPNFPNQANSIGNIPINGLLDIQSLFMNYLGNNYKPTGILLSNKKTRVSQYDAVGNERALSDSIGPLADGYSAPIFPVQPPIPLYPV